MDFFHCAQCGHWPQYYPEVKFRYFLTSCYHLLCERCIRNSAPKCASCQQECTIKELCGQAGNDLKDLFGDATTLVKDGIQQLSKAMQVIQFQKQLQKDGARIFGQLVSNCKGMKGELERAKTTIRELESKLEDKEKLVKALEDRLAVANSPATVRSQSPGTDNLSLFRASVERPNAHVQPMMQPRNDTETTPRNQTIPQLISGRAISSPGGSSGLEGLTRQHSIFRRHLPSSVNSTPNSFSHNISLLSSVSTQSRSPIPRRPTVVPSSSLLTPPTTNITNRTPELIRRLNNLRCRPSGHGSLGQSPGF